MKKYYCRLTLLCLLSALTIFTVLSGCATAYQPRGLSGGYSEINPYEDGILVFFSGNGYSSAERARSYAYYRAAELAKEENWQFMEVKNKSEAPDTFKARIGATGSIGRPVVILYITPAGDPDAENVVSVDEIFTETRLTTWTPMEGLLSWVP